MTEILAGGRPMRALPTFAAQAGGPIRVVRLDGGMPRAADTGATVLVADAHEDSRAVCAMLLRQSGFTVLEAAAGEEVIRLAHAHRPDAIVLGLVLRGVDGFRALEVLKQHEATETIPVVVLGSVSGDEHESRARAAGCAAYLLKPCAPRDVLNAVRAVPEVRGAA